MRIAAVTSIAISSLFLCSCESTPSNTKEQTEEKPQLVGKVKSQTQPKTSFNLQDVVTVRDGNVRTQEVGESATGYSYEDVVTGNRKGKVVRAPDIFLKGFSETEGKYPSLYYECHTEGEGFGYTHGTLSNSLDSKKLGDKSFTIWRADGKTAAILDLQIAPHKFTGVNSKGEQAGKDELGIGFIDYRLKGNKVQAKQQSC